MAADEEVLTRLGVDFQLLDSGCCGMAGAFALRNATKCASLCSLTLS
jgi:Fe-S oxidoreductase